METLATKQVWPHKYEGDGESYVITESINQRFNLITKKNGELFLHRWLWVKELVDIHNNEVLARYVDFSTGNGHIGGEPELRFWLHSDYCPNVQDKAINLGRFIEQLEGAKK